MVSWTTNTRRGIFRKVWGHGVFESSLPGPLPRPDLGAGCPGGFVICSGFPNCWATQLNLWLNAQVAKCCQEPQVLDTESGCILPIGWHDQGEYTKTKKSENVQRCKRESCNRETVEDPGPGHRCRLEGTIIRGKVKIWYLTSNKLTTTCSIHELNTSY